MVGEAWSNPSEILLYVFVVLCSITRLLQFFLAWHYRRWQKAKSSSAPCTHDSESQAIVIYNSNYIVIYHHQLPLQSTNIHIDSLLIRGVQGVHVPEISKIPYPTLNPIYTQTSRSAVLVFIFTWRFYFLLAISSRISKLLIRFQVICSDRCDHHLIISTVYLISVKKSDDSDWLVWDYYYFFWYKFVGD